MTIHMRDVPGKLSGASVSSGISASAAKPAVQRRGFYRRLGKRAADLLLVLMMAPVVLPVTLLLLVLAASDGHSPLFRQRRIGRGGRIYDILKIRTMVPDAEAKLNGYLATNPEAKAEWDSTQKLRRDPRITPAGRFLRKTSLDELPQLWNVLTGDMSLIGPRPMMENQRSLYPGEAYYALRPGITGPWQVSDRNETTFAARAVYDTDYDATLSFRGDLRILWRTVAVVLRGTGC